MAAAWSGFPELSMMNTLKCHESGGVEVFRSPLVDEWEVIGHAFTRKIFKCIIHSSSDF